jgi:RND family efflux transporter MFP subunit
MFVCLKRLYDRLVAIFVIFMLITVFPGCSQEEKVEKKEPVRLVKFFEVGRSGTGSTMEYSGEIKAAQEVDMSFEIPGKILEFPVTEGEQISQGTLLARLDPRDYRTLLDSAKADLNAARADYERSRELYENNTISRRELDVARRNFEKAKAGTESAEKAMGDTRLVAPFNGIIAKITAERYQNIQAKQPILVIHDNSTLEMAVDIPEQDFTKVKKTDSLDELTRLVQPEIIISSLPGKRFKAAFKETATMADPMTRTFQITFKFTPPSEITIFPGMTARLLLTPPLERAQAILIPAKAVFSDDKKQPMIWRIDPESKKVTPVPVTVGDLSGSDIYIKKGLKEGDLIAISGVHKLRDGMTVRQYQ